MKTTILLAAIIFGILAGVNLGVSVASGTFLPISFITSVMMFGMGLISMNLACDMPVKS